MKQKRKYEWTAEEIDGSENIVDADFCQHLSEITPETFNSREVGLVLDFENESEGVVGRFWAYVKNGELPNFFEDEAGTQVWLKVPARFKKELEAYLKNLPQ